MFGSFGQLVEDKTAQYATFFNVNVKLLLYKSSAEELTQRTYQATGPAFNGMLRKKFSEAATAELLTAFCVVVPVSFAYKKQDVTATFGVYEKLIEDSPSTHPSPSIGVLRVMSSAEHKPRRGNKIDIRLIGFIPKNIFTVTG